MSFGWEVRDGVGHVTLVGAERKNPLTFESYAALREHFRELAYDEDVKVVVIRGEGDDFGSGGDLPEQRGMLENPGMPLLHELAINDDDVKYPPGGSYRYLSTVTDFYAKARPATDRCRSSARSASSRRRGTATAGISIRPVMRTW